MVNKMYIIRFLTALHKILEYASLFPATAVQLKTYEYIIIK